MAENINIKLLIDAADAAKSVGETKKALRDLKTAAMSLDEGSQAFNDIATAAGKLQDRIGDLAATTKYLGDDLKNLKGFTSIASGIAGGFAAAQGAAALFGGENKQLEASLLKVQSAMSILQGIQAVGEVLQKESAATLFLQNGFRKIAILLTGEEAVAKAGLAVANGTATITQRALNAAMNANPILAVVGLIALAVTALLAFTNTTKEADKSQEALNSTMSKTAASGEIEIRTFNSQIEALKQLKTGSEDRAIAIKKINDQYGTTLQNLSSETAFLKQVNLAQKDYVEGAKNRILMKINEAKIESFLTDAQVEKEKALYAAKKAAEILASKASLAKALQGKTDEQILQTQFDNFNTEAFEIQRLLNIKIAAQKKADELNKRADNALNINAKLLTQETAQQKAAREKQAAADAEASKKIIDNANKTSKKVIDTGKKTAEELAKINADYQEELAKLAIDTNANLIEQQNLLLSLSGDTELNAIAMAKLETEQKITAELNKQVDLEIQKFKAKTKEGTAPTVAQTATITTSIQTGQVSQFYQISAGLTKAGEEAILQIQKDYAEQRQKIFEDAQKRVLAADEYKRFIEFLKKTKELQDKLEAYEKKFGKGAAEQMKLDEKAREADKEYRAELELLVKTKEQLIATENALLLTNQRNVEYQKKISQELVDEGLQTQEDANKSVADTAEANLKSAKTIAEALEVVKKAKQSLAEDPVQMTQTSKMVTQTKPALSSEKELQVAYEKYKGQTEELFELGRKSNLDQLGNNEKSIEILSALYGEKFNVVKEGEDKINAILAKLPKRPANLVENTPAQVQVEFQFIPKKGQIGLKELLTIDNAEIKKAMEDLNLDLDKSYQENFENEKKYFEKSTFENFNNQQQKLADANLAYKTEISENRKINSFDTPYVLTKQKELKDKVLEINKEFNDKEKTLKENHEENQLAIGLVYGEKTQEDVVQFGKDRLAEKERIAAEERAIEDKKNSYLIAAGQSLFNTLRSQLDSFQQAKLNAINNENELRIAFIDAELKDYDNRDKEITAAEQAKIDERTVIEDKKKLIERENAKRLRDEKIKQFNINKAMDVIQIGINTAVAVTRALATEKVLIPFIIAAGAAEAFFVTAQQANFADGGLVSGPGGPKDDMVSANLSNGEVVINANSSKKYGAMLNAINQAGGGKPIPFRDGGVVTNSMPVNNNIDDFKSLIMEIVNRPIETYVKESSITNAQKSQSTQNRRTSF